MRRAKEFQLKLTVSADKKTCRLRFGADDLHGLAFLAGALEVDFDVEDPPELAAQLRRVADRFQRAAGRDGGVEG